MIEKIGINFWGAAQCWNEKKVMHLIFELGTLRVNESDTQIRNDFNFTTNCYFNTILVSVCPQANEFILSLFVPQVSKPASAMRLYIYKFRN